MNRRKKRTVTLLLVVLLCLISTCVLAVIAFLRSRQVQQGQLAVSGQEQQKSNRYDIFWNGDETLLTREDIVVFDVRYTDTDSGILISLAKSIEEKVKKKGIQPIFLGAETDSELRSELLKSEEMDLYIGLCVGRDEANPEVFGSKCYYNDAYYVPEHNNVWLSDRLLQNVVTEISGKALGMEVCDERDLLIGLNVPAALLQIGYQTNSQEGAMLLEQRYIENMASGVAKTVEEYYEGE